jgi:hypothetical protein
MRPKDSLTFMGVLTGTELLPGTFVTGGECPLTMKIRVRIRTALFAVRSSRPPSALSHRRAPAEVSERAESPDDRSEGLRAPRVLETINARLPLSTEEFVEALRR